MRHGENHKAPLTTPQSRASLNPEFDHQQEFTPETQKLSHLLDDVQHADLRVKFADRMREDRVAVERSLFRSRHWSIAVLLVVAMAVSDGLGGQPFSITLDDLIASVAASQDRLVDIRLKFRIVTPLRDGGHAVDEFVDYACRGEKDMAWVRCYEVGEDGERTPDPDGNVVYSFDGETSFQFKFQDEDDPGSGVILGERPIVLEGDLMPRGLLFYRADRWPWGVALGRASELTLEKTEDFGGSLCAVISGKIWDGPFRVWFDVERDFLPVRRVEYDRSSGEPSWEVQVTEMRKFGDFWFPVKAVAYDRESEGEGLEGLPVAVMEVEPTSVRINEGVDDSVFTIKWRPGTRVTDMVVELDYTAIGALDELHPRGLREELDGTLAELVPEKARIDEASASREPSLPESASRGDEAEVTPAPTEQAPVRGSKSALLVGLVALAVVVVTAAIFGLRALGRKSRAS